MNLGMSEYGEKIFTRKKMLAEQANTSNNIRVLGHSIRVAFVYEQFKCQFHMQHELSLLFMPELSPLLTI